MNDSPADSNLENSGALPSPDHSEGDDQQKASSPSPAQTPDASAEPEQPTAPADRRPEEVELPAPDDPELEKEVEQALGDVNLMDMYDLPAQQTPSLSTSAATGETAPADGICRGRVIRIDGDDIFVDLGGKSQGLLPREELDDNAVVEVGQEIDVVIARYDAKDGLLILSKKTADQRLLRRNLKVGSLVEARVIGSNKGGLEMDIKGMRAFMPISQIDLHRVEDLEPYLQQRMTCEVLEVERGDKNIVLSRRNVLERDNEQRKEQLWRELEKGQTRHGVVRSIMAYGAFVDLGGVEGLLHISELSWARVKHPNEILQEGQSIDVVVIKLDKEKQRVSLSLKQAGGDPWTIVEQKYAVGSKHQAQVVRLMDFGAFAQLEPGVDGLIPISEMTWAGRVRHPSDVVQPGGLVEVEVLKVDVNKRQIALSMKNVQENPWSGVEVKYHRDEIYTGMVTRVTDFGAFVQLEAGLEGLIHISELSDRRVGKVSDVVREGEEIQVKVLKIEPARQRISLSLKGIAGAGAAPGAGESVVPDKPGQEKDGKNKKGRPRRGGLEWDWL